MKCEKVLTSQPISSDESEIDNDKAVLANLSGEVIGSQFLCEAWQIVSLSRPNIKASHSKWDMYHLIYPPWALNWTIPRFWRCWVWLQVMTVNYAVFLCANFLCRCYYVIIMVYLKMGENIDTGLPGTVNLNGILNKSIHGTSEMLRLLEEHTSISLEPKQIPRRQAKKNLKASLIISAKVSHYKTFMEQ